MGLTIFIARLVDVVTDPVTGICRNQFDNPIGRRKPIITRISSGVNTFLYLQTKLQLTIFTSMALSCTRLDDGFIIPDLTWGSDMGKDYEDRTKITSIIEHLSW